VLTVKTGLILEDLVEKCVRQEERERVEEVKAKV